MKFIKTLRTIRKFFSAYRPSVEVLISKDNLLHNLNEYKRKYSKLSFAPVLKSNAYGHGLVQVAQILDKEKKAFFVVDSLFEAMALRNEGIKSQLLIIGYTSAENIVQSRIFSTAFTITSLDQLQEVSRVLKKEKKFHLKIDTGMHRQGIMLSEIEKAIEIIKDNKSINLEGICSHLADADNLDESFTKLQIDQWQSAVEKFKQNFEDIKFFHLSATAGVNYTDQIYSNVIRLGIGLYGINVSPYAKMDLRPVLEMRSVVSSIKTLSPGESVGYNAMYKANNTIKAATVPVGYFEGIDRRLSNLGCFKINNNFCAIIGRVSMNITSIDVTSISGIKIGDSVVVISNKSQDKNSVENVAKLSGTIPYEILVHISQRLKRTVK